MKWIIDEISHALAALQRWQTWLGIGLISVFLGLAYLVGSYAFRTDAILIFLHRSGNACRELSNGAIIAMFFGMIFFVFTTVLTLGEVQQFLNYKEQAAHHQARNSLIASFAWGAVAIGIAVATLVFFTRYCR